MLKLTAALIVMTFVFTLMGCETTGRDFAGDVAMMKKHTQVIVLSDSLGQAKVAVVPAYQGRVMTSTASGNKGIGTGWINDDLVASGPVNPQINVFGGEDRFWLGPEGGQYAIFFKKGDKFTMENWKTPAAIDTEAYKVVDQGPRHATFAHRAKISNYSGTTFDIKVNRRVQLIDRQTVCAALGLKVDDSVKIAAYESRNKLTNAGTNPWTKEGGLLSVWILGILKHSATTTVVSPYKPGPVDKLGPIVNDSYFGKVPADRLKIDTDNHVVYFKADGEYRSKIGISPQRSKAVIGSYDPGRKLLSIVQCTQPAGATDYVNSMWELQKKPYAGDVLNSYNDGPAEPGADPFGPFYELESSSPAAALAPGATITHVHRTMHLVGSPQDLDPIARKVLGVGLDDIVNGLK